MVLIVFMKKIFFLTVLSALFLVSSVAPPDRLEKKLNQLISNDFSVTSFELHEIGYPKHIKASLPNAFLLADFFRVESSSETIGFAYLGQGPSKTDVYDFAVIFDANLLVRSVKILQYREDYGGEIASKRWLRQFLGKSTESEFIVGENIAAISGATISVRSMTAMINQVFDAVEVLKTGNIL